MKWLQQFKEIVDNNPGVSDIELFKAFPELKGKPELLTAALMYWRYEVVAEEFKKQSAWSRFVKLISDAFRRISFRAA
jgi:hypothetical protein